MPKGHYDRGRVQKPFRHAEEPAVKAETPLTYEDESEDEEEPEEKPDAPPAVYRKSPIAEAPRNGETILLYSEACRQGVRGRWRVTRQFVAGRWVVNKYWACPLTNRKLGDSWIEWGPLS